jgi:hypothetical protein
MSLAKPQMCTRPTTFIVVDDGAARGGGDSKR